MLCSQARAEIGWDRGRISKRLVEIPDDVRNGLEAIIGGYPVHVMLRMKRPCGKLRILKLVEALLLEAYGKGARRPASEPAQHADDGAAVRPAAQVRPDLGEGILPGTGGHRLLNRLFQFSSQQFL